MANRLWPLAFSAFFLIQITWQARSGKSLIRYPFPTTRAEDPFWFWFGQIFLGMLIAISLYAAAFG